MMSVFFYWLSAKLLQMSNRTTLTRGGDMYYLLISRVTQSLCHQPAAGRWRKNESTTHLDWCGHEWILFALLMLSLFTPTEFPAGEVLRWCAPRRLLATFYRKCCKKKTEQKANWCESDIKLLHAGLCLDQVWLTEETQTIWVQG